MKRHSKTSSLKDLIENSIFNNTASRSKMNNVIKHSTIFSFWDNVVGAKFSKHTKPYAIKGNVLYISAKSSAIIQELNLYKTKLITKVNSYSMPLGIEIKNIVFNYKNYCATNPITDTRQEDIPKTLEQNEINSVVLDKSTESDLKEKVNKINFLNESQRDILLSKLLDAKKAKIIQDKNS